MSFDDLDDTFETFDEQDDSNEMLESDDDKSADNSDEFVQTTYLSGMYKNWFLDYASYVILERAVPEMPDGLKSVQRRILHSMYELEDGRYNKVANIIGNTMKYHPHGDASIGDALVQLGQKDLLIDTQGNWGNILTGDSAAAPRYIEARLSKLVLDIAFNPKITEWKPSYDGRNNEPVHLPIKFPVLLAQGAEGIAVGLASKILPHNFNELIDASVAFLQNKPFVLYPDFPTGGMADVSKYNDGLRGGRVRIRSRINQIDKRTLSITEIPFGITTSSLIDSIISANDKGKIKIRKIDDNTAQNVEIIIHLPAGVSPDQTIDALYAFTYCERSESPNACVILDKKPQFIGVSEMLKYFTLNTKKLLEIELGIRAKELMESILYNSLEKIFIENRIYHQIEECETWESVLQTIDEGLEPYKSQFYREITEDDLVKLTEIKIKRISKYNSFKADEITKKYADELKQVQHDISNITDYTISYYKKIKEKYSKGRERKTELRSFDTIEATTVAAANEKLYVNREEGFIGTGIKKDEYVCECSSIDDIIVFHEEGTFMVTKVSDKVFVGNNIIHVDVFKRNDERTIYNMIYQDGKNGTSYVKRFFVSGVIRDKLYSLTSDKPGTKVLYFTANPNGEAEIVKVQLKPAPRLKKLDFEFDFSELAIKGRTAKGNILSRKVVRKITQKEKGVSTLDAISIWFDDAVLRLNTEERGKYLGDFDEDEKIITVNKNGEIRLMTYELTNRFDDDLILIEKYNPEVPITSIYYYAARKTFYIKRFMLEDTDKKQIAYPEDEGNYFENISIDKYPVINIQFDHKVNKKQIEPETIKVKDIVDVMNIKAKGKKISQHAIRDIIWLEPEPDEDEKKDEVIDNEVETSEAEIDANAETEVKVEVETKIENTSETKSESSDKNIDDKDRDTEKHKGKQMTLFD